MHELKNANPTMCRIVIGGTTVHNMKRYTTPFVSHTIYHRFVTFAVSWRKFSMLINLEEPSCCVGSITDDPKCSALVHSPVLLHSLLATKLLHCD